MISCIVPAHNEEKYIGKTLDSLLISAKECVDEVEIIVIDDGSTDDTHKVVSSYPGVIYEYLSHQSRVIAKNHGAKTARGKILAFVDADSTVSRGFFYQIHVKACNSDFIGGGVKDVILTRLSLGILVFLMFVGLTLLYHQITIGAFWVRKKVFDSMGGFNECKLDDIDFAKRLKRHAKQYGGKFESLKRCSLVWSLRKFDQYGDWYWIREYR